MLGRMAAGAAMMAIVFGVAGCAGMESAGRNASRSPAPQRVASAPAPRPTPPPVATQTLSPPAVAAAPTPPPPVAVASARPAPPPAALTLPPPARAQAQPTPPPATAGVTAPAATPRPVSRTDDDDVVVSGQVERQVPPPNGDPRSVAERMADINAWDRCVMRVQAAVERDPLRPQLEEPEDYCGRSLGMASRTAVPDSRAQRRR